MEDFFLSLKKDEIYKENLRKLIKSTSIPRFKPTMTLQFLIPPQSITKLSRVMASPNI